MQAARCTMSMVSAVRSPYSYSIAGTINFAYKGINLPITGSYRDAQFSYDYTFNRLGISPNYKWIKLHLGWSNTIILPTPYQGVPFLE